MPDYNVIVNLPGFTITKVSGPNTIVIHAKYHRKARCPHCDKAKLRKKDAFIREEKHEAIGYRNSILRFKAFNFIVSHVIVILINAFLAFLSTSVLPKS